MVHKHRSCSQTDFCAHQIKLCNETILYGFGYCYCVIYLFTPSINSCFSICRRRRKYCNYHSQVLQKHTCLNHFQMNSLANANSSFLHILFIRILQINTHLLQGQSWKEGRWSYSLRHNIIYSSSSCYITIVFRFPGI